MCMQLVLVCLARTRKVLAREWSATGFVRCTLLRRCALCHHVARWRAWSKGKGNYRQRNDEFLHHGLHKYLPFDWTKQSSHSVSE